MQIHSNGIRRGNGKASREMEMNFRFIEYFIKAHSISKHDGRCRSPGIMKADWETQAICSFQSNFPSHYLQKPFTILRHISPEVHYIVVSLLLDKSFNDSLQVYSGFHRYFKELGLLEKYN